jgi:hypothetical protein
VITLNNSFNSKATGNAAFVLAKAPAHNAAHSLKEATLPLFFIGLVARLAVCDGMPNSKEAEALCDIFVPELCSVADLEVLFISACNDNADELYYARRIACYFPDDAVLFQQMFLNLLHVAVADHPLTPPEIAFLKKITAVFHLTDEEIDGAIRHYLAPQHKYSKKSNILRRAYHRFMS